MNQRARRILKPCRTSGRGLEIGPSFNPLAPKREGFNIAVMDHMNREALIEKYRDHTNMPPNYEQLIEEVDYVWDGRPYPELIPEKFDYIISSHLIEHVPDLIGHLNDCAEILKDGGVYSLAVPDKRYSFDINRKETDCEAALARKGITGYPDDVIIEYFDRVVTNDGALAWDKFRKQGQLRKIFTPEQIAEAKAAPGERVITDLHVSVFTPRSFDDLMRKLSEAGEIRLTPMLVDEDTPAGEFFAVFQKGGDPAAHRFHAMPAFKKPLYQARSILTRFR